MKTARVQMPADAASFRLTDFPMHYLASIRRHNFTNMTRALRPLGITPQVWRVLAALNGADGHSIGELAELCVIERSNLSRIVDGMVRQGLLERRQPAGDKRLSLLTLTAKGRRTYEAAFPLAMATYRRAVHGFSAEEFRLLMSLLRRMKDNVTRPLYEMKAEEDSAVGFRPQRRARA